MKEKNKSKSDFVRIGTFGLMLNFILTFGLT